ncbi:methylisocitrate lyase [Halomonas salipaludis]|uniref:Methylisocitrate lyase n=1 Tax=Halomonas salipaludis TaxID=2032625 RepID=A0A2A2ETE0_9GAMM|nr:methylisocitrate lyase [Halomonas salipaludis]PAU75573.1 methylisocitrate lyase [Halomonas salipaludis]
MTIKWLADEGETTSNHPLRFRQLLAGTPATAVAGAYDGMSALLAKEAGFQALYLSGAALSASKAMPDLGLLTLEDVWHASREIVRASDLPLIVDCDTGFGEALNVMRAVRELEDVGVACIQIEDQQFPKKCGHLNDKRVVSTDDMCRKIAAARKASRNMVICARTDAGFISTEESIARANRYAEAGADVIFVEALESPKVIRQVRREVKAPLLANMTEFGHTPATSVDGWTEYGYELVIFPVSAFRVASKAMERFYASLMKHGDVNEFLPEMMPRAELYENIQYYEYEALDSTIARTVLAPCQKTND